MKGSRLFHSFRYTSFLSSSLVPKKLTSYSFSFSSSSSSGSTSKITSAKKDIHLTSEEITEVNLLIPRLCESNHLKEAIHLVDACLLTNPPFKSLSLSILVDRLSSEPDMTQTMFFLNKLKHSNHGKYALIPIVRMHVNSYIHKRKFKEVTKIFNWISRPDFPLSHNLALYETIVEGFCMHRKMLEALKVVLAMLSKNLFPGKDTQVSVYKGLLRDARIREAQMLNGALNSMEAGDDQVAEVVKLLEKLIKDWKE